eukprot:358949-Chlamydomonas_euryale.AAC.2
MVLRDATLRLLAAKRWRPFSLPVDPEDDPEFYEEVRAPMDLATMLSKEAVAAADLATMLHKVWTASVVNGGCGCERDKRWGGGQLPAAP